MRKRIHRPSPALLIAILALAVAASGDAVADGVSAAAKLITGKQVKNETLTSADVKNGSLTLADLKRGERAKLAGPAGPAGERGAPGLQGLSGSTGAAGAKGDACAPGTARAYALVSELGALSRAKNIAGVEHAGEGVYCVRLDPSIDASSAVATVSADFSKVTFGAVVGIDSTGTAAGTGCVGVPNSIVVVTTQLFLPDVPTANAELVEQVQDQGFLIIVA